MARRLPVALTLAALALTLGACQAAHASTDSAWHPALTQPGNDQPSSAPPVSHAPSRAPSHPAAPSPAQSELPDGPPTSAPAAPSAGHGPAGSLTTTGSSAVALTFDDGPDGYSMAVLDLLAEYHIKATFCIIGRQVAAHPDVIRRIVADGHSLCNHTWDHDLMLQKRSAAQITAEMQRTNDAIHAVVPGAPIRYFRAPGGGFSPQIVQIAAGMGMKSLYWQVDPQDWRKPGPQAIINNVIGHTRPGSVVLMHDGGGDRSGTVTALRTILPNFAGRFTLIALP